MAMYCLTVAMAMIPLGFVVFIWGMDKGDKTWLYSGAVVIGIAIIIWVRSLNLASKEIKQDREDRERQFRSVVDAIKGIREDLKGK